MCTVFIYLLCIGTELCAMKPPKGPMVCPASGRWSSKRVPVEDLGYNSAKIELDSELLNLA